jgi:hypothetical protein
MSSRRPGTRGVEAVDGVKLIARNELDRVAAPIGRLAFPGMPRGGGDGGSEEDMRPQRRRFSFSARRAGADPSATKGREEWSDDREGFAGALKRSFPRINAGAPPGKTGAHL